MASKLIILIMAIITLFCAVVGEIVSIENCSDKCTVHQVTVEPCNEAAEEKPCKLKRGKTAAITVQYTPNFASPSLHSRAYWKNGIIDLPLLDMETDGCKTTACPLASDVRQTYTYDLKLSRAFPVGVYPVKWRLSGENDDDECCFLFKIQLK